MRRLLILIYKDKIDTKGEVYLKQGNKFLFISNFSKFLLQKKMRSFKNIDVLIGQIMLFSARAREGKIFAASRCKISGHQGKDADRARMAQMFHRNRHGHGCPKIGMDAGDDDEWEKRLNFLSLFFCIFTLIIFNVMIPYAL